MLSQAPFEETYRIFNFNTMPLYSILIGIGRIIGIDGSRFLKFWPLLGWTITGGLLQTFLYRRGLKLNLTLLLGALFFSDPEMRWASFVVRPESLIGFFGLGIILLLTFKNSVVPPARGLWDPIAALLALSAYSHFNAVHLIFPVILTFSGDARRLILIGARTLLYLSPWLLSVVLHFPIFLKQFTLQWSRLHMSNGWLQSIQSALTGLFNADGNPVPWFLPAIQASSVILWLLIFFSLITGMTILYLQIFGKNSITFDPLHPGSPAFLMMLPSAAWVMSAIYLFHTKPERWFSYYIHASVWCFVGTALLYLDRQPFVWKNIYLKFSQGLLVSLLGLFTFVNMHQLWHLEQERVWNWATYDSFIDCIDERLIEHSKNLSRAQSTYRVWGPTPPDVLIELSRRHPDWEYTRTNDFHTRFREAEIHGIQVEALVVTEMSSGRSDFLTGRPEQLPWLKSTWMNWSGYFLNRLQKRPNWKKNRFICQHGRWLAFIYLKDPLTLSEREHF